MLAAASRTARMASSAASSTPVRSLTSTLPVMPEAGTSPIEALKAARLASDCALLASEAPFWDSSGCFSRLEPFLLLLQRLDLLLKILRSRLRFSCHARTPACDVIHPADPRMPAIRRRILNQIAGGEGASAPRRHRHPVLRTERQQRACDDRMAGHELQIPPLAIVLMMSTSSIQANDSPMQWRGPPPNGK